MKEQQVLEETTFCLSVIGGDPDSSPDSMSIEMLRLQALREKYGLENIVALLGKRSQDTLAYYYSAAKVVVVPSHYESFGLVALEAMACGTPVVASEVGGLAYLVKDGITGFTIPAGEPRILADRLTKLLFDDQLRQKMGSQAAEYAREYAWETIAQRIRAVYSEVLERVGSSIV
jgi:D-inositol-3-phosphate glycosyltransferase